MGYGVGHLDRWLRRGREHLGPGRSGGTGDVAGWRAVGAAMPPFPSINVASAGNQFVEAWLGVCRAELAAGDRAAAAAALAHVDPALTDDRIDNDRRTRTLHEKAVLAAADGDFDASERILQQLLRMRPTWWSRTRVGRCRLEVARRLEARGEAAPAAARRTEAITILNQAVQPLMPEVERRPTDPFYVVPWGFAELDLATAELARGDAEAARSRLARVLPRLAAVRDTAHRDQWDEARFAAAEATLTGNRDSRTNR